MIRPNIVFILSDDQGEWAVNCGKNTEIITPNIDKLAEDGMKFDNFFCSSPVCSPARASIVTGEYPSCHGVQDWLSGGNADYDRYSVFKEHGIDKHEKGIDFIKGHKTYAEVLSENGYVCAHSGKWHIGASDKVRKGYKYWAALEGGGCSYYSHFIYENGEFTYSDKYVTDVITDNALRYIDMFDDNPFYLSVHYTAPHGPWEPENHPQKYLNMYKDCKFDLVPCEAVNKYQINSCNVGDTQERRRQNLSGYYAAITSMDANIGRIIEKLKKSGKLDNTIIIFTSDNGMNMGHHGIWGKGNGTYPQNMYDTSVKVPFIVSGKLLISKNVVNNNLYSQCDIYPTLLDIAGVKFVPKKTQIGKSMLPDIMGSEQSSKSDFIMVCSEYGSVRMIRTEKDKLVICYRDNFTSQYFNLVNDPDEKNNLIDDERFKERIKKLTELLETTFNKLSDQKIDARQYNNTGKGQNDLASSKDAFVETYKYYY